MFPFSLLVRLAPTAPSNTPSVSLQKRFVFAYAMDATACRFFQSQKGCFRGDSCTFKHEYAPGTEPPATDNDSANDFASGADGIMISASNPYANANSAATGLRACRFYTATTGCRNGPQCPFAHIAPPGMISYGMEEQQPIDYSNPMYYAAPGMMPLPQVMSPMMLTDPPLPTGPPMQPMHMQIPPPLGSTNGGSESSPTSGNDGNANGNGTPRRTLSIQANPSKSGNYEVISEILPVLTREIEGPVRHYSCFRLLLLSM